MIKQFNETNEALKGITQQFDRLRIKSCSLKVSIDPEAKEMSERLDKGLNAIRVFWFIGQDDLNTGTLKLFRKEKCFSKLSGSSVYLVDLSAWKSWVDKETSAFETKTKFYSSLNKSDELSLTCLCSSDFFQSLNDLKNPSVINLVQSILERDSLYLPSRYRKDNGLRMSDLFSGRAVPDWACSSKIKNMPLPKLYSVFQYLEIFFYIEKIVNQEKWIKQGALNIDFILPNDEWKYYGKKGELQSDLACFLKNRGVLKGLQEININIKSFRYGDNPRRRYYMSGKSVEQADLDKVLTEKRANKSDRSKITNKFSGC